ncbi:hypothetical protein [Lentimicrobium sp. S6]|uniref:hypothetical protein n=1 Tax=Lentimicrobium sp. S6 TaxID=2735872 RepID=UPI001551E33D|nr:hypothetical protein [Lentimicrobium sp. S6]NPD47861.1 hypothetical protein [Lentimicrobium sp. S6]
MHFQEKYLSDGSISNTVDGFKMPYVFRNSSKNNIWNEVNRNTHFKVIHLSRANLLRAYVSNEIAIKTKYWFGNETSHVNLEDKKCVLDTKDCLRWINNSLRNQKKIEYEFRYHQSLTLTYENLLLNKDKTGEVLGFLGVDPSVKISSQFKKQNKESLSDLIKNYEEFKKGILNSTGTEFLDEKQELEFLS